MSSKVEQIRYNIREDNKLGRQQAEESYAVGAGFRALH
jgi:hypothetical protein